MIFQGIWAQHWELTHCRGQRFISRQLETGSVQRALRLLVTTERERSRSRNRHRPAAPADALTAAVERAARARLDERARQAQPVIGAEVQAVLLTGFRRAFAAADRVLTHAAEQAEEEIRARRNARTQRP